MSYLCLIANQYGAALSADRRLTLEPKRLKLHLDHTKKVFSDPEQSLIWGCCGLLFFSGVDLTRLVSHIMRQHHRSLPSRLNQITGILKRTTSLHHHISHQESTFTLFLARIRENKLCIQSLEVVNGSATLKTIPTPTLLQAGWNRKLYQRTPLRFRYARYSVPQLAALARERCQYAIDADNAGTYTNPSHVAVVGGNVDVVTLYNHRKELEASFTHP